VKSLYSPAFVAAKPAATHRFQTHISRAFIVTSLSRITHDSLTLSGQCAFVRVGFGKSVFAMKQRPTNLTPRATHGSLGHEDRLPPGEGGA
jgi:hypothetical protein